MLWYQLDRRRGHDPENPPKHEGGEVVRVQALAALMGGCTSAVFTNPLDVLKTRLQVRLALILTGDGKTVTHSNASGLMLNAASLQDIRQYCVSEMLRRVTGKRHWQFDLDLQSRCTAVNLAASCCTLQSSVQTNRPQACRWTVFRQRSST